MKKTLLAAATVMLAMTACSGSKTDGSDDKNKVEQIVEQAHDNKDAVVDLTDDNAYRPGFKPEVPTILDFNATWCPPCKALKPVFHAAAERFHDVKFVSVDVDNLPQTAAAYGVRNIPTVIFVKPDGSETRYIGTEELLPADKFDALVQDLMK